MSSPRHAIPFFASLAAAVGLFAVVGCSVAPEEAVDSGEDALQLASAKFLGAIATGETKTDHFTSAPAHAYGFTLKASERVTVDVKSSGDTMAYVTDASFNVLSSNDDATASTKNSKVVYSAPAGAPTRELRVVFLDNAPAGDGAITVKLLVAAAGPLVCTYAGQGYAAGQSFPSTDGCNTCTCASDGGIDCTKLTCACDPAHEPNHIYKGTPKTCVTTHYMCVPPQFSFANACGCGCEIPSVDAHP